MRVRRCVCLDVMYGRVDVYVVMCLCRDRYVDVCVNMYVGVSVDVCI